MDIHSPRDGIFDHSTHRADRVMTKSTWNYTRWDDQSSYVLCASGTLLT